MACGAKSQLLPGRAQREQDVDAQGDSSAGGTASAAGTRSVAGSEAGGAGGRRSTPRGGSSSGGATAPDPGARPGTLDATFGDSGELYGKFREQLSDPRDLVVQPDGKILLAGSAQDRFGAYSETTASFALARFLSDGSPDLGFGVPAAGRPPDGQVLSLLSPRYSCAFELSLWSDGRIAVAGQADVIVPETDLALAVYTAQGELDATFGGPPAGPLPGTMMPTVRLISNGGVSGAIQLDRKPILIGRGIVAIDGMGLGAFRFDEAGAPDDTFHFSLGGAGATEASRLWLTTWSEALLAQPDGKLAIAGMVQNDIGLLRLTTDGQLDPEFGADSAGRPGGLIVTALAARSWPTATALTPENRIVVAGGMANGTSSLGVLLRYTPAGQLDLDFGEQGVAMAPPELSLWQDVAAAPDGKLLAVSGQSLVRFTRQGAIDREFGDQGIVTTSFPVSEVAVAPDGKIVVAGMVSEKDSWRFALARYWP
jgi:uncharacterized delta-60 repeat protein